MYSPFRAFVTLYLNTSLKTFIRIISVTFLSLLKKLDKDGMEPIKAVTVLLDKGKIGEDVVLLLDEIYLPKDVQYQDGKFAGVNFRSCSLFLNLHQTNRQILSTNLRCQQNLFR